MAKKDSNPENLYQRNGVWWIRYYVNGKLERRSLATKSLREAKRLRNEIMGNRAAGDAIRKKFGLESMPQEGAPVPTVGEVLDLYLKDCQSREGVGKGLLKPRALKRYESAIEKWIRPHFGPMRMSEVRRQDVTAFVAKLRRSPGRKKGEHLSPDTVALIYGRLRAVFIFARQEQHYLGLDNTDLGDKAPRPSESGRDVVLTPGEFERLLQHLSGRWYYMAAIAYTANLRWGEVNGLSWDEIDLERGTINVCRQWCDEYVKTEAGAAVIEVSDDCIEILTEWQELGPDSRWLFPSRKRDMPRKQSESRKGGDYDVLRKAAKKAGINKHVTTHVFRHSGGTELYLATGDVLAAQRSLRHKNLKTTLRYINRERGMRELANQRPRLKREKRPVGDTEVTHPPTVH